MYASLRISYEIAMKPQYHTIAYSVIYDHTSHGTFILQVCYSQTFNKDLATL